MPISQIVTNSIAAGAVVADDLANSSVTTAKIADSAITTAKIAEGAVVTADLADSAVTLAKLGYTGLFFTQFAERGSQQSLVNDSGWVDHISNTFTIGKQCNVLFLYSSSSSFESGPVQGFARLVLNGTVIGRNSCVAKQSTANSAGAGTVFWDRQGLAAGTHTVTVQVRNTQSGSTWITPYWSVDGATSNTLGVIYYA